MRILTIFNEFLAAAWLIDPLQRRKALIFATNVIYKNSMERHPSDARSPWGAYFLGASSS
jgi:hypothetical protein